MRKIFILLCLFGLSVNLAYAQQTGKGIHFLEGEAWENVLQMAQEHDKYIFMDCYTSWCGPCKQIAPYIEELAEEYKDKVNIGKCDVDENADLPAQFGVRNIPTVLFIKNGEVVDKQVGATTKSALQAKVEALLK